METHDRRRIERYARKLEDLRLWRNACEFEVSEWSFTAGSGEERYMRLGDFWPEISTPVSLSAETRVPEEWTGEPVELELWLGGEGFVRLSNGVTGGLNPFHRSFPVAEAAAGGETIRIEAEVVSKGLWGSHVAEPRIERAALVVPEKGVRALVRDLRSILAVCEELDGHDVVLPLLDILEYAFGSLAAVWPSGSETAVTRYLRGYTGAAGDGLSSLPDSIAGRVRETGQGMRSLWSIPEAPGSIEPLPERARHVVEKVRGLVAGRLEEIKKEYPPVGRLALTGHAHIDLAWLWPLPETRRKARRTFASVLELMDRYEDFTFNQSSAQLYAWVEEDTPEIFERIKERVAEGRWEPVGGSWCEPDCQIPSGESFVRQLLHGQRYFMEKFGRRSTVAWLPDAFGFSPGIPQLLRGAGITGFYTAKLKWSETNRFPHDLFEWEGIDGSRVSAHFTYNPGMDYNGDITPFDLLGVWRNFKGKRNHRESLFSFGWGDGGGGPSEQMLESYARLKDFPAMPRLSMTRVDDFYERLPREKLPRWVGELYLELHRGTLTTQGKVKKLNREAEHRLLEAEAFAAMAWLDGAGYPSGKLDLLWKTLLLNQFHDILPGTSISEVYEEAHRQLAGVVEAAQDIRDRALGSMPGGSHSGGADEILIVGNASVEPRPLSVILDGGLYPDADVEVVDAEGNALPIQEIDGGGVLVHAPDLKVPGLGCATLRLRPGARGSHSPESSWRVAANRSGEDAVLENKFLRVAVGPDGNLRRVYDKEVNREVLNGRGNQLWAYVDKPREWDAWDVDEDYELEGEEISGLTGLRCVESGPLLAAVRVERRWRDSVVDQTYVLCAGSRRLDIETRIEWREREVLLRALFPLAVRSGTATYETMYGAHERPTHRNTSWDAARFEVSAHRFADLSEPGYGAALLNDGRYGHGARENTLGISLLRSPMYPDPFADEGRHHFTYSLFPHPGDWTEAGVAEEAFALNSPLVVVPGSSEASGTGFLSLTGVKLALGSLKRTEDGRCVALRLYEPHGARGRAELRFAREVVRVERANLLEEPGGEALELDGGVVRLTVRPFEVITLIVEPRSG